MSKFDLKANQYWGQVWQQIADKFSDLFYEGDTEVDPHETGMRMTFKDATAAMNARVKLNQYRATLREQPDSHENVLYLTIEDFVLRHKPGNDYITVVTRPAPSDIQFDYANED